VEVEKDDVDDEERSDKEDLLFTAANRLVADLAVANSVCVDLVEIIF